MDSLFIREYVPLAPLTTFGLGGPARALVDVTDENQLPEALAYASRHCLPVFILGGGSNLLVPDDGYRGLVLHMLIGGVTRTAEDVFEVGAGVPWDAFVDAALEANCAGVECLAGIPGSTGGTPVQNVGAYGQEVSGTIREVRAYDRERNCMVNLSASACGFRYRASIFNTTARGRYIVTRVTFELRPGGVPTLKYADLQRHFSQHSASSPSLVEVAAAVREIRRAKGMLIDITQPDADTRSAGSYFKNPIVPEATLIAAAFASGLTSEKVPHWPAGSDAAGTPLIKLPAAWLLERSGFTKGYGSGPVGVSTRHTLALVNRGGATFADLQRLEHEIIAGVERKFAITLEREPVVLG